MYSNSVERFVYPLFNAETTITNLTTSRTKLLHTVNFTFTVKHSSVRRILVKVVNAPLSPEAKKILKKLTTKWCILKYTE